MSITSRNKIYGSRSGNMWLVRTLKFERLNVLQNVFYWKRMANVLTRPGGRKRILVTGLVVTWFLLGYTVRMFEYTVRTLWSNVGRFLYVFSSIPRKLYTIFQPTFSPIKRYQDSIFKLLNLSTNSVTNVVRTAYFQIQARSSPLKILWQSLYSK